MKNCRTGGAKLFRVGYKEYSLYVEYSFIYFIGFVLISFLLSGSYIYIQSLEPMKVVQKKMTQSPIIQMKKRVKPIDKMINLFKYITLNEIQIKKVSYYKNKIH